MLCGDYDLIVVVVVVAVLAQRFLAPRLATMSLYNTGWYGGVAVKAASAFLVLGSNCVVTSLWKVDDVPTVLFYLRFYGEVSRLTDLACRKPVPVTPQPTTSGSPPSSPKASSRGMQPPTAPPTIDTVNVDLAEALNAAQLWLSKVSVIEAAKLLRDFGKKTLANDVERVYGGRGMCVCGGRPRLWGRLTCHCSPFEDPVYWSGFVLLGATECIRQYKVDALPLVRLFPPPPKEQEESIEENVTGMPEDKMAIVGSMSIMKH